MRLPIRIRLSALYSAILIVVIAALELAGYISVRGAIHSIVDHELETRLAGIEDHILRHLDKTGWIQMRSVLETHPAFQAAFLVIRSERGEKLFEGHLMRGIALPEAGQNTTASNGEHAVRLLSERHTFLGKRYDIIVGTDLRMPADILRRVWLVILLSMPPLLLVCAAAGYWMSGHALAPIQQIVDAARSIDSRRLNQRVPVPATGDEVQQLAETFNSMLERIEAGFRQMRDFTANASHELRTPVAIVRAAAEVALVRRNASEAFFRETLERILRESERNTVLLENMLEISRAESGVDGIRRDWLNLNESLAGACEQATPLAASRDIALHFQPASGPVEVNADPEQLRRLWLILLDNAIKYTAPGGIVIARTGLSAENIPQVEIVDTGIGIAKEHLPLIFDRFYRTDKARGKASGGTGLGLAIAREIALVHDADILVESEPGKGSRFLVRFVRQQPVEEQHAHHGVRRETVPGAAGGARHSLSASKPLVRQGRESGILS